MKTWTIRRLDCAIPAYEQIFAADYLQASSIAFQKGAILLFDSDRVIVAHAAWQNTPPKFILPP